MELEELIKQIKKNIIRSDINDETLEKDGHSTRKIGEFSYGISYVPCSWVYDYLLELKELKKTKILKLKENDYVRLNRDQGINKVDEISDDGTVFYLLEDFWDKDGNCRDYLYDHELEDEVLKHGTNIWDVIEVGDLVDEDVVTVDKNDTLCVLETTNDDKNIYTPLERYNWKGKTILTAEEYYSRGFYIAD